MAYDFVLAYAERLWPTGKDGREHLASTKRLGSHVKEIYATPTNLFITREKEAEMLECQVTTNVRTSTVESMNGCRVRSYLTALLLSDEEIPAHQPMSVSKLLRKFMNVGSTPTRSDRKRNHTTTSHCAGNESPTVIKDGPEPEPAHKRHRFSDIDAPTSDVSPERSSGYVRLRFTYSGNRRLQRMLFCPYRPASVRPKGTRAIEEPLDPIDLHSSNGRRSEQAPFAVGKYQCWLQSCGKVFQTTEDAIDHIQQQHALEHGRLMKAAFFFAIASFDVKPDEVKGSVAGSAENKAL
jgi:hypothetical protein